MAATRESSSSDIYCASLIDHILSLRLCLPFLKVFLKMDKPSSHMAKSLSLLEKQEEEYQSIIDDSSQLKNHILCLKLGFTFLRMFLEVSDNKDLRLRIERVLYDVRLELHSISNRPVDGSLILDLDRVYTNLREKMKNVIIKPGTQDYDVIFPQDSSITSWRFGELGDFLLHISGDLSSCKPHLIAPLMQEIEGIRELLTLLQPLRKYIDAAGVYILSRREEHSTPVALMDKAAGLLHYICLVDKMNEGMALAMKSMLFDLLERTNVEQIYMGILRDAGPLSSSSRPPPFSLLHNLLLLLKYNGRLSDPSKKIHDKLEVLYTKIDKNLPHELRSANFSYLLSSIEALAWKSIPILYSCHVRDMNEDVARGVSNALSEVLDRIEHIQEDGCTYIKYLSDDYPKTDGLGFWDRFLGYIELLKRQRSSDKIMRPLLAELHVEFDSLRPFLRKFKEDEGRRDLWRSIICLGYQTEFLIDLCLVKTSIYQRSVDSLSKIMEQTKLITVEVNRIYDEGKSNLQAPDVARTSSLVPSQAIDDEETDEVVGFGEVEREIKEQLVGDRRQLDFISIDGMPGAGKTTLARKMYEDPSIVEHFTVRAWCTVSQTYRKRELLASILEDVIKVVKDEELAENPKKNLKKAKDEESAENPSKNLNKAKDEESAENPERNSHKAKDEELAENPDENSHEAKEDENKLAEKLYKKLKGRRYLIVFDDMWDIEAWNEVQRCFPDDGNRSRILITTRLQNVASNIKAGSKVHTIHELTDVESWKLFQKTLKAKKNLPKDFEEVGKRIAKSCKGLPLAIVVIAGLLAKVNNVVEWKKIAESLNPYIVKSSQSPVTAILELSYNHLPDHLKSCFLYFGAFKEDEEIPVRKLKWLWIAEGFVQNNESEILEEVAEGYFKDLISRSLVIASKERSLEGVKTCHIHDLLREFCLEKAKDESFLELQQTTYYSSYHRRLIIHSERSASDLEKAGGLGLIRVRSLLYNATESSWSSLRMDFIFENLKLLTMLDLLNYTDISSKDFSKISLLIHLKYLAIQVETRSIPSSISNLWKLQFLIFHSTADFSDRLTGVEVPDSLWDMVNLRVVCIQPRAYFFTHAKRLVNKSSLLENLETLSAAFFFEVDSLIAPLSSSCLGDGENFLGRLPKLRRLSCIIQNSTWDESIKSWRFPYFDFLTQLVSLKVVFCDDDYGQYRCEFKFPSNLQKLTLSRCQLSWDNISIIGSTLPHLKVLKIEDGSEQSWTSKNGTIWNVDDGDFPGLKYLKLSNLSSLKEWIASDESFPNLKQLVLEYCKNLNGIPPRFGGSYTLRTITVMNCNPRVKDSARNIQKEQKEEMGNEKLKLYLLADGITEMEDNGS